MSPEDNVQERWTRIPMWVHERLAMDASSVVTLRLYHCLCTLPYINDGWQGSIRQLHDHYRECTDTRPRREQLKDALLALGCLGLVVVSRGDRWLRLSLNMEQGYHADVGQMTRFARRQSRFPSPAEVDALSVQSGRTTHPDVSDTRTHHASGRTTRPQVDVSHTGGGRENRPQVDATDAPSVDPIALSYRSCSPPGAPANIARNEEQSESTGPSGTPPGSPPGPGGTRAQAAKGKVRASKSVAKPEAGPFTKPTRAELMQMARDQGWGEATVGKMLSGIEGAQKAPPEEPGEKPTPAAQRDPEGPTPEARAQAKADADAQAADRLRRQARELARREAEELAAKVAQEDEKPTEGEDDAS